MSQYHRIQFEHPSDEEAYRKYFPDGSNIENEIHTIYEKMGESTASILFRGAKRGLSFTVKVYKEKLPFTQEEMNQRMDRFKNLEPHPRVCRVLKSINDYESEKRTYSYVIMDFTNGKGLDDSLEEEHDHKFPQRVVLNWAHQLLEGLAFLHSHEMSVHLKLSNIVRKWDDSICISDISHLVSQLDEALSSASNIPDEQRINDNNRAVPFHENQVRRDIFHLGSVLFELLTGYPPVKEWSNEEKKKRLTDNHVFDDVADVIVKAIDEKRSQRWKDSQEMMRALEHLPLDSTKNRKFMVRIFADIFTFILGLSIGLGLFTMGNYRIKRAAEMEQLTQKAALEWVAGQYTKARSTIEAALNKKTLFDPPPSSDTLRNAAEYLGAYRFSEGFVPFYSIEMAGQPIAAALSPQETTAAVMTKEMDAFSMGAVRRIHLIRPQDGKEIGTSVQAASTAAPDFAFLDSDAIAYIDGNGKLAVYDGNQSARECSQPSENSGRVVRMALSGNREVIACLYDDGTIYTASVAPSNLQSPQWIRVNPGDTVKDAVGSPADRLFALDEKGSRLVVSFSGNEQQGASLKIYSVGAPSKTKDHSFEEAYNHFEGGFYEDCVVISGWFVNSHLSSADSSGDNSYISGCHAIYLNGNAEQEGGDTFKRLGGTIAHAFADESGIYFSNPSKSEVNRLIRAKDPVSGDEGWSLLSPLSVDANVRFLQHIPGYILIITGNNTVELLRDDGSGTLPTSNGIGFSGAAASKNYLLLFGQSGDVASSAKNTLSVMKWSDANVCLTYDNSSYRHQRFQVLDDKSSVMLYGLDRNSNKIFRIWAMGGENGGEQSLPPAKVIAESPSDIPSDIRSFVYLRPTAEGDPAGEYLKIVGGQDTVYYSARDGKSGEPDGQYQSETLQRKGLCTKDYLLKKSSADHLDILRLKNEHLVRQVPDTGIPISASQCADPEILFVSLLDEENAPYCLLLDKNMDTIARLSGSFAMLPDGTLYCDNGEGSIIQGWAYSKEDLAEQLRRAGEAGK